MNIKSESFKSIQDQSLEETKVSAFKPVVQESDQKHLVSIAESSIVNIAEKTQNSNNEKVIKTSQSSQERQVIYAEKVLDT